MKKQFKNILALGMSIILTMGFSINVFGYTRLYESRQSATVVKGVQYDKGSIYTTEGNVDYYVLKVDLNNDSLSVKPIESVKEISLKETVQNLVGSNGAVAGVNSAYFGLAGDYSASFGPVIADGELISVGTDKNISKNEFATFFIDEYGDSFMDYARVELEFLNNGESHLDFASINKITEMKYPIYFDTNGGEDTAQLDRRFTGLVKIVVEDEEIVYISEKGETVDVPKDGYVIIISSDTADKVLDKFEVGQSAEFNIISTVDFENIESAISGGGIVLKNGVKPSDLGENATGRNPRTLLGTNKEGDTLILMCIDGKRATSSTSIGATLDEAIELMKAEGAYNAMSLDGGGSTTMVADFGAAGNVELLNNPAGGSQRKVTTAAAVFDESETGEVKQLVIEPSRERGFYGSEIKLNVYGLDENMHRIDIPASEVYFSCDGGSINGNVLTVKRAGVIPITASYKNAKGTASVTGLKVSYIAPTVSSITLENGGSAELSFVMTSVDGYSEPVTGVKLASDFVKVEGNKITAVKEGSGYVECSFNSLKTYVKVGVGTVEKTITSFEGYTNLGYSAYPKTISGIVGPSSEASDGNNSVAISYNFAESNETQAAYLTFNEPIVIEGEPTKLRLAVYGDGSGNWIRGKIKDANGNEQVIDFTRDMNWNGWQDVEATVPAGIKYPISLTTVYVAALSNNNLEKQVVYFDNLRAEVGAAAEVSTPADIRIADNLMKDISSKNSGSYYITIGGDVVSKAAYDAANGTSLYTDARVAAFNEISKNTDLIYYAGGTDISKKANAETVVYDGKYKVYDKPNATIVQMTAANGGIKNTDVSQWTKFINDVKSLDNENVIFVMDRTPSNFTDNEEMNVFRNALNDIKEMGKNVFVVSAGGYGYWSTAKDGIRYINLPDLWYETGSLNSNYKVLRFEVTSNGISYDVESVF